MKNNQKTPNDRTLLGLRKRIPSPKPKEERILETVNRIVSRIQNDKRNYKWENTLTKLAWECLKSWETQWPSFVRNIKSMNQTLWDVPLLSLFRHILTPRIMTTDLCSSDLEKLTDIPRILHPQKTLFSSIAGSFSWISDNLKKGSGKLAGVVFRICGVTSFHRDPRGFSQGNPPRLLHLTNSLLYSQAWNDCCQFWWVLHCCCCLQQRGGVCLVVRAVTPIPLGRTVLAPLPLPMGANTSVNGRMAKSTGKALIPLPMEEY